MNDNHVNYKQLADQLFKWWEEDQKCSPFFTPWIDDINKLADFSDWLNEEKSQELILNKMCEYFKDVDDAEEAANKLYNFIQKGINNYFEKEAPKWFIMN